VGEPLHHKGWVNAVAFSPDGNTVITGSDDCTARLWDVATGVPVTEPLPHEANVRSVAFSPDGKSVCTGSVDGTARLWQTVPLPPAEPERLRAWVRVRTGRTFNEHGVLRDLSPGEWLRARAALEALGGDWRFK
jgi:hypothetical protein